MTGEIVQVGEVLVKRVDTPATVSPPVGDTVPLQVDSKGRLWTRPQYPQREFSILSGSTDGEGILIDSSGTTTLHTSSATSNVVDIVHLTLSNITGSSVVVTLSWAAVDNMKVTLAANDTDIEIVAAIENAKDIKAQADTVGAAYAVGYVERITNG